MPDNRRIEKRLTELLEKQKKEILRMTELLEKQKKESKRDKNKRS